MIVIMLLGKNATQSVGSTTQKWTPESKEEVETALSNGAFLKTHVTISDPSYPTKEQGKA